MKNEHVLELLDGSALRDIASDDMQAIRRHVGECAGCKKAFEAAVVSAALLAVRISESEAAAPSPFFNGKVMNAIRARANVRQPIAAFREWWQASFSMVALMLIAVFGLAAVAVFAPAQDNEAFTSTTGAYTPDTVIMEQVNSREFTNEQALEEVYGSKVEVKK